MEFFGLGFGLNLLVLEMFRIWIWCWTVQKNLNPWVMGHIVLMGHGVSVVVDHSVDVGWWVWFAGCELWLFIVLKDYFIILLNYFNQF